MIETEPHEGYIALNKILKCENIYDFFILTTNITPHYNDTYNSWYINGSLDHM